MGLVEKTMDGPPTPLSRIRSGKSFIFDYGYIDPSNQTLAGFDYMHCGLRNTISWL